MTLNRFLCLSFLFLIFFKGWSQHLITMPLDEVFVTNSRFELSKEYVGRFVDKISSEVLEKNRGWSLAQLLNRFVGVNMLGSYGQSGSVLSTTIRGGQNRQVLVLIDGIPVNDPSQIENNFDFNLIGLEQIEYVEILKGASSVLYGANASTAVINIVTKSNDHKPLSISIFSMLGTNNSSSKHGIIPNDFQNRISVAGSLNKFSFGMYLSHRSNDGLSAIIPENIVSDVNSDAFNKTNLYFKLGYSFSNRTSISGYINSDRYNTGYDESFGFLDANYHAKNKQLRMGLNGVINYDKGSLNINVALNKNRRSYSSSFPTKFDGQTINFDMFYKTQFRSNLHSVFGIKYSGSEMNSYQIPFEADDFQLHIGANQAKDANRDSYANLVLTSEEGFNLNAGIRLNHHSNYNTHFVYSVNPFYKINFDNRYLKLMASYATAFISPSLYQLFVPSFGNSNLDPQMDATLEFGMEFRYSNLFEWSTAYYKRNQMNFIDYIITNPSTYSGVYQNVSGETSVQGVEISLKYIGVEHLNFDFNYAFTESKTRPLFRIPKHKININADYDFSKSFNASVSYQFTGKRTSTQQLDSKQIVMKPYNLYNIGFQWVTTSHWVVFARIVNVFNQPFEEIFRYSTLGRNYALGVEFKF